LRVGKARFGLADIADGARALALQERDLAEDPLMLRKVVPRQPDQLLVAQHVEVGFDRIQADELRGLLHPVGGGIDPRGLTLDLALGREPVEQHLGQGKLGVQAQERLRVAGIAAAAAPIAGGRTVGPFRPGGAAEVDRRQILGARLAELLIDRLAVRGDHADVGVGRKRRLDAVLDRGGKRDVARGEKPAQEPKRRQ
jgi:hypothetical protein